jgi:hypothetical protein
MGANKFGLFLIKEVVRFQLFQLAVWHAMGEISWSGIQM